MILVISNRQDITVDFMLHQTAAEDVFRLNAEDLVHKVELLLEPSRFVLHNLANGRWAASENITGVWLRRPNTFKLDVTGGMAEVYKEQIRVALAAVVDTCAACGAGIMNDPQKARRFSNKAVQYTMAARYFQVPEWFIASPSRVPHGVDAVVKALASYVGTDGKALFTRKLADIHDTEVCDILPVLVQRRIEPVLDARVVAIGGECFVAAMPHGGEDDWRRLRYDEQPWAAVDAPHIVRDGLPAMLRDCGLLYCSADFLVDADGVWHFIDLNPHGQYGWLELKCDLPISAAIHDCLAGISQSSDKGGLLVEAYGV